MINFDAHIFESYVLFEISFVHL